MHRYCRCNKLKAPQQKEKEEYCEKKCNEDDCCKGYSASINYARCNFYTTSDYCYGCDPDSAHENKIGEIEHYNSKAYSGCALKKPAPSNLLLYQ